MNYQLNYQTGNPYTKHFLLNFLEVAPDSTVDKCIEYLLKFQMIDEHARCYSIDETGDYYGSEDEDSNEDLDEVNGSRPSSG